MEATVDYERASELLTTERHLVESLLEQLSADSALERSGANAEGDMADSAESLVAEQESYATAQGLQTRLAAITMAEQRIVDGTFGLSVRSGELISDERLEADPAADLTFEEAQGH